MGAATIGPDTKPGGTSGEMMGNGTEHAGKMLGKCWESGENAGKMVEIGWISRKTSKVSCFLASKLGNESPFDVLRSPIQSDSNLEHHGASSTAYGDSDSGINQGVG